MFGVSEDDYWISERCALHKAEYLKNMGIETGRSHELEEESDVDD